MKATVAGHRRGLLQRSLVLIICIFVRHTVEARPVAKVADLQVNLDSSSRTPTGGEQQPNPVLLEDYAHDCTPPSECMCCAVTTAVICCKTACSCCSGRAANTGAKGSSYSRGCSRLCLTRTTPPIKKLHLSLAVTAAKRAALRMHNLRTLWYTL
jgi:hypothetical protein